MLAGWDAFNLSPPEASEDQGRAFQLTLAELQWFRTVLCCASPSPLETLQKYIKKDLKLHTGFLCVKALSAVPQKTISRSDL